MKKNHRPWLIHYLFLISILVGGVWLFHHFTGLPDLQFLIVILGAVLYIIWGVATHYVEGDFHPKIMVEYLLIAILSIILARGAIFR